jgi:hypothetical protein
MGSNIADAGISQAGAQLDFCLFKPLEIRAESSGIGGRTTKIYANAFPLLCSVQ